MAPVLKIAIGSLVIGAAVFGLKLLAWALTGSVALLSDALESVVNLAAALAALIAIQVARQPADDNHPFGHHKAEYFSAVLEGVLIVIAAFVILNEAWGALFTPRAMQAPLLGLLINGGASVINAIWAAVLLRQGARLRSPALVADGKHLWADVVTSAGVAVGVGLALVTGWWVLDPIMAALVAVNILWSGQKLIRASLSSLMDEAIPESELQDIRDIISAQAQGAAQAHDLRTRHAGRATFVEFHLVVPGQMSVFDAHEICDRIEAAIKAAISDARITIHVEPEHKSKSDGIMVLG